MQALRALIVVSVLALGLGLTSCGGGGGGGGTPPSNNALLSGPYFAWIMGAKDAGGAATDTGDTTWGVLTADGAGGLTGTVTENNAGILSGPNPIPGVTYAIAADRATSVISGIETFDGWTNATGTLTTVASTRAAQDPSMIALLKLGSGVTNADLAGDFHLLFFAIPTSGAVLSGWGSATFDDVGTGTYTFAAPGGINQDGAVVPGGAPGGLSYALSGDGSFSLVIGSIVEEAALLQGGEMFLAVGRTDGGDPSVFVGIRKTAGATAANLSGDYQIIGIERDGGGFSSITGSFAADGVSAFSATFSKNTDGLLSTTGPSAGTYTVAADGRTVVTGGAPLEGGVSTSGNVACVAGPTVDDPAVGLFLLFRK